MSGAAIFISMTNPRWRPYMTYLGVFYNTSLFFTKAKFKHDLPGQWAGYVYICSITWGKSSFVRRDSHFVQKSKARYLSLLVTFFPGYVTLRSEVFSLIVEIKFSIS